MKKTLLIGVFAAASLLLAGSKTYDITISKATKAGSIELAPGEYSVKLEGNTVTFTDSHRKSLTTPVKVESSDRKFNNTSVLSSTDKILSISLGGSTTKINFVEPAQAGNN
jgi:hypothetical protein